MISSHEPDFEALDALLDGELSMAPDELMGALVAVFSTRQPLVPSQWLPVVFGERELSEADGPALSALFRQYNQVGETLEKEGMLAPEMTDIDAIQDFCNGYLAVMDLDEGWFIEERETEFVLSALVDPSLLDDPNLELDGGKVQWLARACRDLPSLLQQLYLRNRGRLPGEGAQAVSKKVERNAPCPCGSGRKYKKCCGAG